MEETSTNNLNNVIPNGSPNKTTIDILSECSELELDILYRLLNAPERKMFVVNSRDGAAMASVFKKGLAIKFGKKASKQIWQLNNPLFNLNERTFLKQLVGEEVY